MVITILMLFSSCDNNKNVSNGVIKDEIVIGFAMDTLKEERWQRDRDIFVAEAEKLGAKVLVLAANGDDKKQIDQAKYLLSEGSDVLVVVPHNGIIAKEIVEIAHRVGVKVIAYDRLIEGKVDYYVSFDNEKVGELQAKYIIENLKITEGNIVYLGGASTDNNAILLRDGAMNILNRYDDINIIYDEYSNDWNPRVAKEHMKFVLDSTNENIDAVICANDALAGTVASLLAERKMELVLTGQDAEISACQRIVEGKQTMTVYKDVRLLAKQAAKMAVDIVNRKDINTTRIVKNETESIESVLLNPIQVDKNNMMELIIKNGFHKFSDVYRNILPEDRPEN
jgi:D-xylose transport system substrate-binding protein